MCSKHLKQVAAGVFITRCGVCTRVLHLWEEGRSCGGEVLQKCSTCGKYNLVILVVFITPYKKALEIFCNSLLLSKAKLFSGSGIL